VAFSSVDLFCVDLELIISFLSSLPSLYLRKATLKEKLGDKAAEELLVSDLSTGSASASGARMIPSKSN